MSLPTIVLQIIIVSIATLDAATTIQENAGDTLHLTKNEQEKLTTFKGKVLDNLVENYMKSDFYLIRWLKAKEFNVEDAEEMLIENLNWRKENNMSNILSEDFSDVSENYPVTSDTVDKLGRPIGTANLGYWDIRKGVEDSMSRVLRYIEWFQETLVRKIFESRKSGSVVNTTLILADMTGFIKAKLMCSSCAPVMLSFINGLEAHYPGFIGEVIVINAPATFERMMTAASGLLSSRTRESIKLLKGKEEWMAYLDERIDRDQRYVNFGGTKDYGAH